MEANKNKAKNNNLIQELCKSTWEPLYKFIYYKVQNHEEAEDITQETYAKVIAYIKKNNITIEKNISFLKTVSLNIIRDRWRKGKKQGTNVNIDAINPEDISEQDLTEHIAEKELIKKALDLLSEEQKKVIELRILKGYSVADTAKVMNKKENSLRVLQHRALKNLTEILKNEF